MGSYPAGRILSVILIQPITLNLLKQLYRTYLELRLVANYQESRLDPFRYPAVCFPTSPSCAFRLALWTPPYAQEKRGRYYGLVVSM